MPERLYTVNDIKQFFKDEYDLDWRDCEVVKDGYKSCIKNRHFNKSCLRAPLVVYRGKVKEIYWVNVSNRYFSVYGKNNQHKSRRWQKLLENKQIQEQNQENTI